MYVTLLITLLLSLKQQQRFECSSNTAEKIISNRFIFAYA